MNPTLHQTLSNRVSRVMLIVTVMVLLLSACDSTPAPYLRVGTNVWPGYEPLYLARELNYLKGSRVHLVEHDSTSSVITAFNNQTIEAAAVTLDEALLLLQNAHDIYVVLVMDISHGGDVIVARPGINSLADLAHHKVAVESNAMGAYVLSRALSIAGLTLQDIELVKTSINDQESIYAQGKADAIVTFDPVRTRLLNQGATQIFDSRQIPGEIVDVLVVRRDYINQHPEVVARLIDIWYQSLEYMQQHPDDANRQISRRLKLSTRETADIYKGLILPDRAQNNAMLQADNGESGLLKTATRLRDIMLEQKLLKHNVEPHSLFINNLTRRINASTMTGPAQ